MSHSIAALAEREGAPTAEVLLLVPGGEDAIAARAAAAVQRELETGLTGCTFAIGRSRIAEDAAHLARAASEALLAANVAQGSDDGVQQAPGDGGEGPDLQSADTAPGDLEASGDHR